MRHLRGTMVAIGAALMVLGVILGVWADGVWLIRLGCLGVGLVTGAAVAGWTRPPGA